MPTPASTSRYGAIAQGFHWVIAALIVVQFALGWSAVDLPVGMEKLKRFATHKSFGMTILMLAVLRLIWRLGHKPPALPGGMAPIETALARATHAALYVLLFAMPLTGWLMSSAKNYPVSWFGMFTWPDLLAPDETAFNVLRATHDYLSDALFAVALLHIAAALKHHFWNRDDVLIRMLPFAKSEREP